MKKMSYAPKFFVMLGIFFLCCYPTGRSYIYCSSCFIFHMYWFYVLRVKYNNTLTFSLHVVPCSAFYHLIVFETNRNISRIHSRFDCHRRCPSLQTSRFTRSIFHFSFYTFDLPRTIHSWFCHSIRYILRSKERLSARGFEPLTLGAVCGE